MGLGFLPLLLLCTAFVGAQDAPLQVVATTTILADVARNVGGELVEVRSLAPPDADVHAFQPAPDDVATLVDADVVLEVGAGLERFLGDLLANAGGVEPVVVSTGVGMLAFGEHQGTREADAHTESAVIGILGEAGVCADGRGEETAAPEAAEHAPGDCDPHVWTDPRNVMIWAANIAAAFTAADPDHAEVYCANAAAYIGRLVMLDEEVRQILSAAPEEQRVLVTNHEFLAYFAGAYDFKIVGAVIPGGSTLAEPDPQELADLVTVIEAAGVRAIFAEKSASPTLAEAVADETGIEVVTTLYSDSLSAADGPASTYVDYLRYNAQTIADALTG